MFCKNCGQPVNPDVKFCKNCGQEIKLNQKPARRIKFFQWFNSHKKGIIIALAILVVLPVVIYILSFNYKSDLPKNYNVASSVVNVLCLSKDMQEESGGSGTIISEEGIILTNAHVIPQIGETPDVFDERCLIILPDESTGQPKEIYLAYPEITKDLSKQYDIAVLHIDSVYTDEDGKSWGVYPKTFPSFQFSSKCGDEYIELGSPVKVYGYPITSGGYSLTITDGIVSSFSSDGMILTSAKIDSGNSGGLAIDDEGCFIGIPSAIAEGNYQNFGVIIPPNLITDFIYEVPAKADRLVASCNSDECYFRGQCIKRPENSICTENDSYNAWECNDGYLESGNYCVKPESIPTYTPENNNNLCMNQYGANTYWDGEYCQCNSGYVWNKAGTACITRTAKCQEDYPNTYWNGTFSFDGKLNCDCLPDHHWNPIKTFCISPDQECSLNFDPHSLWSGEKDAEGNFICICEDGYEWNSQKKEYCVIKSNTPKCTADSWSCTEWSECPEDNGFQQYQWRTCTKKPAYDNCIYGFEPETGKACPPPN